MMEKIRLTGALLYIALALGIGGIGMAIEWLAEQVKVAKFVLWDLQRFFMGRYEDEPAVSSAPPPPTPTHADRKSMAKHLFRQALHDFAVSEVFLEWIRVDPPTDGESDVYLVTPGGITLAYGVFTGDERDGWIDVMYYTDIWGILRRPKTQEPHQTKESP